MLFLEKPNSTIWLTDFKLTAVENLQSKQFVQLRMITKLKRDFQMVDYFLI